MGDNLLNIALHSLKIFPCGSKKVYLKMGLDCLFLFPEEELLPVVSKPPEPWRIYFFKSVPPH